MSRVLWSSLLVWASSIVSCRFSSANCVACLCHQDSLLSHHCGSCTSGTGRCSLRVLSRAILGTGMSSAL
eukprot:12911707-Prorocentrum_lima.AAC.1